MKLTQKFATAALGSCLLLLVGVGCSSLSSRTVQYVGAPRFAPTDATRIEILQAEPSRPFDRLGEVVVDTSVDPAPPIEKVEAALRRDAARLGADAVVLIRDQSEVVGMTAWGPWWSPNLSPIHARLIVAVAIKYKP